MSNNKQPKGNDDQCAFLDGDEHKQPCNNKPDYFVQASGSIELYGMCKKHHKLWKSVPCFFANDADRLGIYAAIEEKIKK